MSEVGTKLDLARAYIDMGDPDGARNILEEVLPEGTASQKQEAQRLIDSLPGREQPGPAPRRRPRVRRHPPTPAGSTSPACRRAGRACSRRSSRVADHPVAVDGRGTHRCRRARLRAGRALRHRAGAARTRLGARRQQPTCRPTSAVLWAMEVDRAFHARYSAVSRTYRYRILNRRATRPAILRDAGLLGTRARSMPPPCTRRRRRWWASMTSRPSAPSECQSTTAMRARGLDLASTRRRPAGSCSRSAPMPSCTTWCATSPAPLIAVGAGEQSAGLGRRAAGGAGPHASAGARRRAAGCISPGAVPEVRCSA